MSSRKIPPIIQKYSYFGNRNPVGPMLRVLIIGFFGVLRINKIIIDNGSRLFVINLKNINGRGVGRRMRFSLYIPKPQVYKDFFDYSFLFYERDYPHGTPASGTYKRIDLPPERWADRLRFSESAAPGFFEALYRLALVPGHRESYHRPWLFSVFRAKHCCSTHNT
jgi:hypothetical protein